MNTIKENSETTEVKLYLVSFGDYECAHNVGIYSTREMAVEVGEKIKSTLNALNEMYKIRTFDDLPDTYKEAILSIKSKEEITTEDIEAITRFSLRRKITDKDSLEHQELDKKYGNSTFYKMILPDYDIEEYVLNNTPKEF